MPNETAVSHRKLKVEKGRVELGVRSGLGFKVSRLSIAETEHGKKLMSLSESFSQFGQLEVTSPIKLRKLGSRSISGSPPVRLAVCFPGHKAAIWAAACAEVCRGENRTNMLWKSSVLRWPQVWRPGALPDGSWGEWPCVVHCNKTKRLGSMEHETWGAEEEAGFKGNSHQTLAPQLSFSLWLLIKDRAKHAN